MDGIRAVGSREVYPGGDGRVENPRCASALCAAKQDVGRRRAGDSIAESSDLELARSWAIYLLAGDSVAHDEFGHPHVVLGLLRRVASPCIRNRSELHRADS